MNKQKETWNELAVKDAKYYIYSEKGVTDCSFRISGEKDYQKHIYNDSIIRSFVPDFSICNILEIGCGIGRMTELLASDFKSVFAIDVSGKMIERAKTRMQRFNNVNLFETDGNSFAVIDSGSIDLAFSYLVFQHISVRESIENNFREVNRSLKNGGLFKVQIRGLKTDYDQWYSGIDYNLDSAKKLCEQTGFELIKYDGINKRSLWLWLKK